MSLTSTASAPASRQTDPATIAAAVTGTCPDGLGRAVRTEVRRGLGCQDTADRVAAALRPTLPDPAAILPASLRRGGPAGDQSHPPCARPDGNSSIPATVC